MAIFPGNRHPDYSKNIQKLLKEGFYHPSAEQTELPKKLRYMIGAETFLVNDAGDVKSVHQVTGEVKDVVPTKITKPKGFKPPR